MVDLMLTQSERTAIATRLRNKYPEGTRVELLYMNDPYTKIPKGTKGTVSLVDSMATIHVKWDNGSSLGVAYGEDEIRKVIPSMVLEMYYNKETDCLQRVLDGKLINHDEYINGSEFIPEFGEDFETVNDIKNASVEDILEAYDSILMDFKGFETEEYIKSHFENIAKEQIQGELILERDINAEWINSSSTNLEILFLDNNKKYKLR